MIVRFDPLRALKVLLQHGVRFVIVGGVAGRALGSPTITNDLDICYERSAANYEALAQALRELGATLRGAPAGLPFILDARSIKMGDSFTFETLAGPLDCLGTPSGTNGYADLITNATELTIDDLRVMVVSLDDLLRMKRAAGRPKDRVEIEILSALKEEREKLS
jgi:predicted nucleotidyltransferase